MAVENSNVVTFASSSCVCECVCVSACVAKRSRSTWQIALGLVARPFPVGQLKYSVTAAFSYIHIIAI